MSEWSYEFTRKAERSLSRLQPAEQRRVLDALDRLIGEPLSGDIRKLRVLFVPLWQKRSVLVREIGHRSNIYGD